MPDNFTPITSTGALGRNGQFCFIAAAVVPGGAAAGTSDQMTVTGQGNAAAAAGGGYTTATAQTNTDVVTVIAAPGNPDLTLTKTHSGNFTVGSPGTYILGVQNIGGVPTSGPITVTDTLPPGLAFVPAGSGGVSWSCSAVGQIVTCASSVVIPSASPHPNALTIVVNPSAAALAASPVTNTATVSGGGEPLTSGGNNGASDPTLIDDTASLSGRVWRDQNHDRRYDAGETLLEDFIVELMDGSNNVLRTVKSNGTGAYSIDNVAPGSGYRLRFRDPATGHPIRGAPVNGEQGIPVSTATVNDGILENLTLNAGDTIAEQSLPLDPSGVVYDAITRQPVAGAVVTLLGPAGFD
ncbi:MAG: SdrD B-like domain-containing protein, partial [bacterium]